MESIIGRLREVLLKEKERIENRISRKFGHSELKALESGVAIVDSELSVEPGSLVGKRVDWEAIEPIGFVVDSKQHNQFNTRYVIRALESDSIPRSFEMAEAEFLYCLEKRLEVLERYKEIIGKFVPAEKTRREFIDRSQIIRNLDEYELEAVEASLSLEDGEILMVMGPPGTGKTQFITEAARLLGKRERVFVTSQVHQAIDNMFERLPPISYALRIGSHRKISEGAKRFSLEHRYLTNIPEILDEAELARVYAEKFQKIAHEQHEILSSRSFLVGATATKSITEPLREKEFDTVFIDEAHNLCISTALLVLSRARKAVIVGDYWQLPPIYTSININLNERAEFSTFSFFNQLMDMKMTDIIWLRNHYRSNEKIIGYSVKYVYGGRIKTSEKCKYEKLNLPYYEFSWLNPHEPIVFFEVDGRAETDEEKSTFNTKEARIASWIAKNIIDAGIKTEDLAILTPFNAQTRRIKKELKNMGLSKLTVRTVHRYVGGEKDVIIFSVAATDPWSLTFIDKRLINVTVTRAKKKLIVIASREALSHKSEITKLHQYIQTKGQIVKI